MTASQLLLMSLTGVVLQIIDIPTNFEVRPEMLYDAERFSLGSGVARLVFSYDLGGIVQNIA